MADLLLLEPVGGIAGDMFLALCVDLGVPVEALREGLAGLPLEGWRFEVERARRHEIEGTHLEVRLDAEPPEAHEHEHEGEQAAHGHTHGHEHPHPRGHHHHDHGPSEHAHVHRSWADIRAMLQASVLAPTVKERALAVFARLAEAEAKVHGIAVDEVSFHEVGAVDSIVDVVGAALAIELLGNPRILCAPPPLGSGLVRSAHGTIPVPAPATVELLRGRSVLFEGHGELTTPTGAAIVAALTEDLPFPPFALERAGYGLGTRDPADRPNVLRGMLGRAAGSDEATWVLEANLDDATPQLIAWAMERLLAEGALDVWVSPLTMKKGRPGHLLGALVAAERRESLAALMLRETTTLGVRMHPAERVVAERSFETVETGFGPVRVKLAAHEGHRTNATPEYEDCARLAREQGVPLKEVLAAALAALRSK